MSGVLFLHGTGTLVNLSLELSEFGGDMRGMAIHDWGVSSVDLAGVVHDDHLSHEAGGFLGRVVLGITDHESSLHFLDGDTLHVEPDVVTWLGHL